MIQIIDIYFGLPGRIEYSRHRKALCHSSPPKFAYIFNSLLSLFNQIRRIRRIRRNMKWKNSKAIPETGRGCVCGYEISRIPRFPYDRFADGEVVSLTRRPRFTPHKDFLLFISVRGWINPRGVNAAGRIRSIEKMNDLIGNQTHNPSG
jgi:hypothetical protein